MVLGNVLNYATAASLTSLSSDKDHRVKLHFLGANRQVTGSKYCVETNGQRVLVDCGLFQERKFASRNWDDFPIEPGSVDAVVLTHAHIDHCGLLPRFIKKGFSGHIYTTQPTADLLDIMLRDAAHIQLEDIKYKEKRHKKEGRASKFPYEPLYNEQDVADTVEKVQGIRYYQPTTVTKDVNVTFHDAGHILGSASVEMTVSNENDQTNRIIFSGDIGQWNKPLVRDPSLFTHADYVVMESTYGDRDHAQAGDIESQLADVIQRTTARGGKVVIPTFAVERSQELMYYIGQLIRSHRVPGIPVFLDSPMAVDVTEIFRQHRDAYDAAIWNLISQGVTPLRFPGLTMSRTTKQSKAINQTRGPAVIMSTSGMCTAGRIKHHLRNHIGDARSTVLFVGFQGEGTLGRHILDGKEEVRIHGKNYEVRAEVARIYGLSGHADRRGLLRWRDGFQQPPRRAFVTHGEEASANALARHLQEKNWQATVPAYRQVIELG